MKLTSVETLTWGVLEGFVFVLKESVLVPKELASVVESVLCALEGVAFVSISVVWVEDVKR